MTRLLPAIVVAFAVALPSGQRERPLLDDAQEVGKWLRATAQPAGDALAWPATPGATGALGQLNSTLYSGTPGVVLFFLELHNATRDQADLAAARGGADWLITRLDAERQAGLYTGLAGIGFALTETWKATGDVKYRDAANRAVDRLNAIAKPVGDGVEWSPVTDIISGTAGIGLYLLSAARDLDRPDALELATRAGRRLAAQKIAVDNGAKWPMAQAQPRMYPNFSHGTAGVAYFLATLSQASREPMFLETARAGAKYLLSVAKTDGDVCLVFHHEPEADGLDLFYLSWCHGPAGTARLFQRLATVTGEPEWREWVRRAARGIRTSGIDTRETPGFWNNVGQCCGSAGVGSFFLAYYRATGDRDGLDFARAMTRQLLSKGTRDSQGLRWVHAEHRVRPTDVAAQTGWMQGAAGIGAWLLELDSFDKGRRPRVTFPDSPF
jgi:lantibiotic modifying enzyme